MLPAVYVRSIFPITVIPLLPQPRIQGRISFPQAGKVTGSDKTYSSLVRVASNGGKILGVSATGLFQYSKTGEVTRYGNISIGSEPDVMEITSTGTTVVFNNDQRLLGYNTQNGVRRWNPLATGDVTSLAMTGSGSKILVGTENGHVDLF